MVAEHVRAVGEQPPPDESCKGADPSVVAPAVKVTVPVAVTLLGGLATVALKVILFEACVGSRVATSIDAAGAFCVAVPLFTVMVCAALVLVACTALPPNVALILCVALAPTSCAVIVTEHEPDTFSVQDAAENVSPTGAVSDDVKFMTAPAGVEECPSPTVSATVTVTVVLPGIVTAAIAEIVVAVVRGFAVYAVAGELTLVEKSVLPL